MIDTDRTLIEKICKGIEVKDSLDLLIDRHIGIFVGVINRFVPANSLFCDKSEIIEDKLYHIYNAAIRFDFKRNVKFSTFLANYTKYVCLNMYNKAKRRPMLSNNHEDYYLSNSSKDNVDHSHKTLIKEIYSLVDKHPDRRVGKLLRLRYEEGKGNKTLSWKEVAPEVGLSIQGCINVHNMVIKDLKKKLKLNNKI